MKPVKAFQCVWCRRLQLFRSNARRHEKKCTKNPDVRACKTCKHEGEEWTEDGLTDRRYSTHYCGHEDKEDHNDFPRRNCPLWEQRLGDTPAEQLRTAAEILAKREEAAGRG